VLEGKGAQRVLENGRAHLETVVHVLDAALGETQVTQVDFVKDHSLQHIVRIVKTFSIATITCGLFNDCISTTESSLLHSVQTVSGAHPASYLVGKAAGA
jgi:hypothetical protein